MYNIKSATDNDLELLIKFKLDTVLNENNIDDLDNIINYVKNNTVQNISNYKLITIESKIVGSYLVYPYEDGVLLDEIYLIEDYRNKGIATEIITHIQKSNFKVYLWVQKNNLKAISLYKRLHFKIIEDQKNRYKMLSENVYYNK